MASDSPGAVHLASINGGLHAHAIYLLPPKLRNGAEPQDVFTKVNKRLCAECRLMSFDARPVTLTPERVVGYVLKSLTINRFHDSTIWLYPKARSELSKLVRGADRTRWTRLSVAAAK